MPFSLENHLVLLVFIMYLICMMFILRDLTCVAVSLPERTKH